MRSDMIKKMTLITSLFTVTSVWGGIFSTDYVCQSEQGLVGLINLPTSDTTSLSINTWLNKATIGITEYDYTEKGNKIKMTGVLGEDTNWESKVQYSFDSITKELYMIRDRYLDNKSLYRAYECREV